MQYVTANPAFHWPLLGHLKAWEACFVIVGLPGVLVAFLVLALREPARRESAAAHDSSLKDTLRHLRIHWRAYTSLTLGFAMLSIVMNTYQLWGVQYLVRLHGLPLAAAGLQVGSVIAVFGTLGVVAGGWYHDRLQARHCPEAALQVGLIAAAAMLPFTLASTLVDAASLSVLLMAPIGFFASFGFGASGAAIVLITPSRMRATASAIYLFFLNALAMGMGPLLTARLNDAVFEDDLAVGKSVCIVASAAAAVAVGLFRWGIPHFRKATHPLDSGGIL